VKNIEKPSVIAVLCEDVRDELNRKHTLLGVFAGDINVQHFPANLKLAAYLEFRNFPAGKHDFSGEVSYARKPIMKLEGEMEVKSSGTAVLVLPSFILPLAEEGQLEVIVKGAGGKPTTVISSHVSVGPIPSLSGTPAS
jgi:hypothetical protein